PRQLADTLVPVALAVAVDLERDPPSLLLAPQQRDGAASAGPSARVDRRRLEALRPGRQRPGRAVDRGLTPPAGRAPPGPRAPIARRSTLPQREAATGLFGCLRRSTARSGVTSDATASAGAQIVGTVSGRPAQPATPRHSCGPSATASTSPAL